MNNWDSRTLYRERFEPLPYLEEYYGHLGSENRALLQFFADAYHDLPVVDALLEFGGGPTVYQLISAVAHAREIHFADLLPCNLEFNDKWIHRPEAEFDWTRFFSMALSFETNQALASADVERRVLALKAAITRLLQCDALTTPPIDVAANTPYAIVSTSFALECAAATVVEWRQSLSKVCALVQSGGWLIIASVLDGDCYVVGDRSFPTVRLSRSQLLSDLQALGFQPLLVRMTKAEDTSSENADCPSYRGIIMVKAQRG